VVVFLAQRTGIGGPVVPECLPSPPAVRSWSACTQSSSSIAALSRQWSPSPFSPRSPPLTSCSEARPEDLSGSGSMLWPGAALQRGERTCQGLAPGYRRHRLVTLAPPLTLTHRALPKYSECVQTSVWPMRAGEKAVVSAWLLSNDTLSRLHSEFTA
jgi:hypothetical protein